MNNSVFFSRWYTSLNSSSIFLTFDDGPNIDITPGLIKILNNYKSTATFFVNGTSIDKTYSKNILEALHKNLHTIGNHGFNHSRISSPRFDIMHKLIKDLCGINTFLIRSPYGIKKHLIKYFREEKESIAFHWNLCFKDWQLFDMNKVITELPYTLKPGQIILLHDGVAPDSYFKDRNQVLLLTELICDICKVKQIPLRGLSSEFPSYYFTP